MPHRSTSGRVLLALAFLFAPHLLQAAQRLDDSASPRSRIAAPVVMSEQGRPLAETLNARYAIVQFGRVDYKLATAAYQGKAARIYYVIPSAIAGIRSPAAIRVDWRSQGGRFAGGSARPGDRQLVWSGVVKEPWMVEALEVTWHVELGQLGAGRNDRFGFEAYFEIEVIQ